MKKKRKKRVEISLPKMPIKFKNQKQEKKSKRSVKKREKETKWLLLQEKNDFSNYFSILANQKFLNFMPLSDQLTFRLTKEDSLRDVGDTIRVGSSKVDDSSVGPNNVDESDLVSLDAANIEFDKLDGKRKPSHPDESIRSDLSVKVNESKIRRLEPWLPTQVFQALNLTGHFNFKTCTDKYWTSELEKLECNSFSIGPLQNFELVAVKSSERTEDSENTSWMIVNKDGYHLNFTTLSFQPLPTAECYCQILVQSKPTEQKEFIPSAQLEVDELLRNQSLKNVAKELQKYDADGLVQARKKGILGEYLVQQRTKHKTDKFCW